jgi:phage gp36-like protein
MSGRTTCNRKQAYTDWKGALIGAVQIRKRKGLSRRDPSVGVYICDVCGQFHVGSNITDEQREQFRQLMKFLKGIKRAA